MTDSELKLKIKENAPRISVIMSVYNAAFFLRQAIDCILEQTFKDFELVCVNDGSTDDSLKILKEYASKDKRVKIISQKNQGAAATRNAGIKVAKGKWFLFLDSDDFFEKNMLEKMIAIGEKELSDIVVAGYFFHCQDKDVKTKQYPASLIKKSPCSPKLLKSNIYHIIPSNAWSKLFLAEKVLQNNVLFENLSSCNDLTFVYVMCSLASQISFTNDCFVHYRTNTGFNISANRGDKAVCILYALNALYQRLISLNLYSTFQKAFLRKTQKAVLWELSFCSKKERENIIRQIDVVLPKDIACSIKHCLKLQKLFSLKNIKQWFKNLFH